mmetsp:Transcript_5506/g.9334  ORF Transcript_5506/g.9334 Transcript_5506/m.9334 type:complete len:102 (-) Transcript_5506:1016-1321(-)
MPCAPPSARGGTRAIISPPIMTLEPPVVSDEPSEGRFHISNSTVAAAGNQCDSPHPSQLPRSLHRLHRPLECTVEHPRGGKGEQRSPLAQWWLTVFSDRVK